MADLCRAGRDRPKAAHPLADLQATIWEGRPVLGFMAETHLSDLKTVGFKNFNPMWSFPTTSVYQNWDQITFGMPAYHLTDDTKYDKDALVSQSPIVVFKAATVLQALGIIHSRFILPSSDVKGEKKNKTYCPSTWNHAYQYQSPAEYSDMLRDAGASSILSHECVLSVIVQLSSKSSSHPGCSFADSASSVLSGMMVSLTPVFVQKIPRPIELSEHVEFNNVIHMFNTLNEILCKAEGFSEIPETRTECQIFSFPADQRHKQGVICPEQDCESLVYHNDQERSMIEVLK